MHCNAISRVFPSCGTKGCIASAARSSRAMNSPPPMRSTRRSPSAFRPIRRRWMTTRRRMRNGCSRCRRCRSGIRPRSQKTGAMRDTSGKSRNGETSSRICARLDACSDLVAAMDRDDACGEIAHLHVAKTGALHHRAQRVLVRMLADGFGEIAVTRLVVGDQFSQPRQHLEGMEIVERLQQLALQARELQDQPTAAGFQYALHFGKRLVLVCDIAQAERDGHRVEATVWERQRFSVQLRPAQARVQTAIE